MVDSVKISIRKIILIEYEFNDEIIESVIEIYKGISQLENVVVRKYKLE